MATPEMDLEDVEVITVPRRKSVTWESDLSEKVMSEALPSTSLAELTDSIVREIDSNVSRKTEELDRNNSLFFQIVCGGNVEVIRSVFQRLKDDGNVGALNWIVGTPRPVSCGAEGVAGKGTFGNVIRVILFLLFAFSIIVSTPVFYIFHAVTIQMCLLYRRRISKNIDLPLMYALISEEAEMVKLFLENGCHISNCDVRGNNVYHYIADLSLDEPEKAFRCHEIIITLVKNINKLNHVITKHKNSRNLTPWDSMAKYGSLHLYRHIAMDQCGIGSRILSVSQDLLWAKLPAEDWTQVDDNAFGSGLDLDTRTIVQEEHEHPAIIDVWEFDVHRYNQGDVFGYHSYPLHILTRRSVEHLSKQDASSLLTFALLRKWMRSKIQMYIVPCIMSHILNICLSMLFLIFTIQHGGDMHTAPLAGQVYGEHIREMQRVSHIVGAHSSLPAKFNTSVMEFASGTLKIDSCVLHRNNFTMTNFQLGVHGKHVDSCMDQIIKDIYQKCEQLKMDEIISNTYERGQQKHWMDVNIRIIIFAFIAITLLLDLMSRLIFLWANFNWKTSVGFDTIWTVISRTMPGSYFEKQLGISMYTLYFLAVYVGFRRKEAMQSVETGYMAYNTTLYQRDSPISRQQLINIGETILNDGLSIKRLEQLWGNLIIVCLLLRFMQLIYILRLLPGIGFFVITAKKMSKHLAQFAAIFVIVSLAFATIFYLVMKNPDCPAMNLENFTSLSKSLFTIYQVFLGYGEYDFSTNVNARLAYIAYTVTTVLLLLNLVIAVMTTTVEELNRMPWKRVMCLFEVWDEILGIEASVLTITFPIRYLVRKSKKLLQLTEDVSDRTSYEIICWSRFEGAHASEP